MALTMEDRVEIPDTVVFRDLDGEVVILDLESSTYFGLDPVGTRMWTLLSEHGSLAQVFEVLQQEYDVDSERLRVDLLQLANRFCERGLAKIVVPPQTAQGK